MHKYLPVIPTILNSNAIFKMVYYLTVAMYHNLFLSTMLKRVSQDLQYDLSSNERVWVALNPKHLMKARCGIPFNLTFVSIVMGYLTETKHRTTFVLKCRQRRLFIVKTGCGI